MTVVVQPVVSEEKLRELLGEQAESDLLDFKRTIDLRETKDLCELSKDVGAMQVDGGYIIFGADDQGQITGELDPSAIGEFDEARLRPRLLKYLSDNIRILTAAHEIDGKSCILLYVAPNPDGFAIFKQIGQYEGGVAFRQGDVYVRHGTSSEPWNQGDVARIIKRIVAREKEAWFRERAEEEEYQRAARAGADLARTAPAEALSWSLDDQTMRSAVIDLLRRGDTIPLTLFFTGIPREAAEKVRSGENDALEIILDRLVCLAALFMELGQTEWLDKVIEALVRIYDLGFDDRGGHAQDLPIKTEGIWLAIIAHVVALGALAVRQRRWDVVRRLATTKATGVDFTDERFHWHSWIRHGLTMAAREELFRTVEPDGKSKEGSLISLAHALAQREECLRPDLAPDDESLLTSICQFDALAMVATIAEARELDVYYPSFARYYEHRTQPILADLIREGEMREQIFPLSDDDYANVLRYIDDVASKEGFRFQGWRMHDPAIASFLQEHPPSAVS